MPLYEFCCKPCQFKFEAFKSLNKRHKANCPKCGELADKIMSVVNHTFGWRLTDRTNERFEPKDEFEKDV